MSLITGRLSFFLLMAGLGASQAQVVLDGKFGTGGALTGPNYNITAGLGATRGNNLFHSFTQFDLKAGDVAAFSGPANIRNIMSRVTGGSPSSINGTIRSDIVGANFFFINPSGILFGPNAVVDVTGAFAASTANYLKLADGARFMAALDADDSVLSTSPVAAFGFLEGASGTIEVRGALKAASGTTLSVVGSTVAVTEGARLEANNGQINLTGVSAPGEVAFSSTAPPAVTRVMSGPSAITSAAGSSDIVIRGGKLVVDNAKINSVTTGGNIDIELTKGLEVINNGEIRTESSGPIKGGNITINAPTVLLDGLDPENNSRIAAETRSDDPLGAGGNIVIRSDSLTMRNGSEISVSTEGAADAGRVDIATGVLRMTGSDESSYFTQIAANAAGFSGIAFGAGGEIVIRANSLQIENGALLTASTSGDAKAGSIAVTANSLTLDNGQITTSTFGAGDGGDIHIQIQNLTLDGAYASINAFTLGLDSQAPAGRGGIIDIKAGSLKVLNDSTISAGTYGDGNGGLVSIEANTIVLNTGHPDLEAGVIPGISASSSLAFDGAHLGRGGDISIKAGSLTLQNGMLIAATTATPGDGGNINIQAGSISLETKSSIQSASESTGRAGTISIESSQEVLLSGNSSISTSALQSSGGNINVTAGNEIQLTDSRITAQAGPAGGGSITLNAPSLIYLLNSTLTAQAVGDGGNLTIDPIFFVLNNSSLISKSSSANGGNITILSDYFFQSSSIIDASAPFGLPGTVSVSAPNVDLSGSLVGLPSNLLGIETQLRPDCGVRLSGNISSFILLGRGGLPIAPGGFVPSGSVFPLDEGK